MMAEFAMRWICPSQLCHGILPDCSRTGISDGFAMVIPEFDGSESSWSPRINRSMSEATGTVAAGLKSHAAVKCAGGRCSGRGLIHSGVGPGRGATPMTASPGVGKAAIGTQAASLQSPILCGCIHHIIN